jgi:hypothetical protein
MATPMARHTTRPTQPNLAVFIGLRSCGLSLVGCWCLTSTAQPDRRVVGEPTDAIAKARAELFELPTNERMGAHL